MTSRPSRFGDPLDRLIVGGEPEQVDRDDRPRLQPSFALDHVDRRFEAGDVDIVGVGIDVDEHRLGLGQRHHLGGRGEGEARHEHRVARSDAGRIERQQQRVGAVGAGDGVLDADIGGDLALELGDLRPENVFAAVDDAIDGGLEAVAEPFALRAEIDELHQAPEAKVVEFH